MSRLKNSGLKLCFKMWRKYWSIEAQCHTVCMRKKAYEEKYITYWSHNVGIQCVKAKLTSLEYKVKEQPLRTPNTLTVFLII